MPDLNLPANVVKAIADVRAEADKIRKAVDDAAKIFTGVADSNILIKILAHLPAVGPVIQTLQVIVPAVDAGVDAIDGIIDDLAGGPPMQVPQNTVGPK